MRRGPGIWTTAAVIAAVLCSATVAVAAPPPDDDTTASGAPSAHRSIGSPRLRTSPSSSDAPGEATADDPQEPAEGRVLVGFEPGVSRTQARLAAGRQGRLDTAIDGIDAWIVETDGDPHDVAAALETDARVAWASPDHARTALRTPDDPYLGEQRGLDLIRATEAWERTVATGTVVAVLDTGVDAGHPDLAGRVLPGLDLVDGDADPDDEEGHGTLVAGIIGARTNNGRGIAGLAWNTRILPVRVLDAEGGGYDSDIAAGIVWAAEQGADVINLSLGGPQPSPAMQAAADHARSLGVVLVAAAGNDGLEARSYPAAISGVVAVGATDEHGRLTDFSNWGDWIDLAAPGFDVLSTAPRWFYPPDPYAWFDGTSAAAPFVSATAALMLAQDPALTPAQVVSRLRSTARDAGRRGIDPWYGRGVLDTARAVGAHTKPPLYAGGVDAYEPNDVPSRGTALSVGTAWSELTSATIAPEGDSDWYRLTTTEPGTLAVRVTPPGWSWRDARSMDPVVVVHRDDGRLLAEVDDGSWGEPETALLDVLPGTYLVEVRSFGPSASNGHYHLAARLDPGAGFRFASARTVPTGASAGRLVVLDVTGDGHDDLVVATSSHGTPANHLEVHAGGPDGIAGGAPLQRLALRGSSWHAAPLAIGDLDGDGTPEVLAGTRDGVQVFAIANGTLSDTGLLPGTTPGVTELAVADLDLDGALDVVVGTVSGRGPGAVSGVWLHHRQEDGSFGARRITTWASTPLAVADVLGDERPELILTASNLMYVLTSADTPSGYTAPQDNYRSATGAEPIRGLVTGDVTGDDRADIVVSAGFSVGEVSVHPGGDTELGARRTTSGLRNVPGSLALEDVTQDGRTDVLVTHSGYGWLTVLPQLPDGRLGTPERTSTPDQGGVADLAVADLDGDGRPDVAIAGAASGLHLLAGRDPATPPAGAAPTWVRTGAPADNATGVAANATFTLDLFRDLQPSTVTATNVRLLDGRTGSAVAGAVTYDPAMRRIRFTPAAPLLEGRTYQLRVSGLRDTDATPLPGSIRRFATVADPAPGPVTGLTVTPGVGTATLRWTAPSIPDLARVVVRTQPGRTPPSIGQGTVVYEGTHSEAVVSGLQGGQDHAFSVFVVDHGHQVSPRVTRVLRSTALGTSVGPATVTHGSAVTITGSLFPSGGSSAKGLGKRTVELLARAHGATSFGRVATATTASDGSFGFTHKPSRHVEYRVRFTGAGDHLGVQSGVSKVSVRTKVTATLSAKDVARNAKVTLSGKVAPTHAGQKVTLQRRVDGVWKDVTTATLSSASEYRFTMPTSKAGTTTYRVLKPKDADHSAGGSSAVTLRVR